MPLPQLPAAPTPADVANFVSQVGEAVSNTINEGASSAEKTVTEGATAAINQITKVADTARGDLQRTAEKAQADMMAALNQITRVLGALPAALELGSVNGQPFYEPVGALVLTVKAVNEGKPTITIETHEPGAVSAFQALAASGEAELRARARSFLLQKIPVLNNPGTLQQLTGAEEAAIIIAIASLVMAIGVSIFIVLIGLALIYAISKNYDINEISIEWTGSGPKLKIGALKHS